MSERHAMVEGLESRRHLSVTLAGGVLSVVGTPGGDDIRFELRNSTTLRVRENGRDRSFSLSAINSIQVDARAGNDRIDFEDDDGGVRKPTRLIGGDGNDRIDGGEGPDVILGGNGADEIDGEGGNDWIDGGAGHDELEGGWGNDTLLGGLGNDDLDGDGGADRLEGGDGQDDLKGGAGVDVIFGGAGNDDFDDEDAAWEIKDRSAEDRGSNVLG